MRILLLALVTIFPVFSAQAQPSDSQRQAVNPMIQLPPDSVIVAEIFSPESNLDPEERAEELIMAINRDMSGFRRMLFSVATPVMLVLIGLFQLFLLLFLPWMIVQNLIYHSRLRKERAYKLQFNDILGGYLNSPEILPVPVLQNIRTQSKQRLLLEYIGTTIRFYRGRIEEKLIEVFRANIKPENIRYILKRSSNFNRAKLFRRGIMIPPRKESALIASIYINYPDADLRLWSRMIYLRAYPESFITSFKNYRYFLTRWEQTLYCELLRRRQQNVPDFIPLLSENNPSVVLFALRMMSVFGQILPKKIYENFSTTDSTEIRDAINNLSVEI